MYTCKTKIQLHIFHLHLGGVAAGPVGTRSPPPCCALPVNRVGGSFLLLWQTILLTE